MRSTFRRALAALALTALAACSGGTANKADDRNPFLAAAQGQLGALLGRGADEARQDARQALTPAAIAASPVPFLLMVVERNDTGVAFAPVASNRDTIQWGDPAGAGLLRRSGVLVGTRGFGFDLHTADITPLLRALAAGGGSGVERINRYIDGENQVVAVQYLCSVREIGDEAIALIDGRYSATVYEERCTGDGPAFTNRYWIDRGGLIRRTRELVHPETGFVTLDLLGQ